MYVSFFRNGQTMMFDAAGEQIARLQRPWLLLYVEFLESEGINPLEVTFELPGGQRAHLFKTEGGYNWELGRASP